MTCRVIAHPRAHAPGLSRAFPRLSRRPQSRTPALTRRRPHAPSRPTGIPAPRAFARCPQRPHQKPKETLSCHILR